MKAKTLPASNLVKAFSQWACSPLKSRLIQIYPYSHPLLPILILFQEASSNFPTPINLAAAQFLTPNLSRWNQFLASPSPSCAFFAPQPHLHGHHLLDTPPTTAQQPNSQQLLTSQSQLSGRLHLSPSPAKSKLEGQQGWQQWKRKSQSSSRLWRHLATKHW